MLCYAMQRYAMLCYVLLWYTITRPLGSARPEPPVRVIACQRNDGL